MVITTIILIVTVITVIKLIYRWNSIIEKKRKEKKKEADKQA